MPPPTLEPAPFRPTPPVVVGLLGGIAAGKSAVAACFATHGLVAIEADAIARQVSAEPAVLAELRREFGAEIVRDGALDRARLAQRVFAEPAARGRLEAILHPRIRARILAELAAARAAGQSVLLDAPLLLEGGLIDFCDVVVFVAAATAVRQARAAARGWAAGELERREAAQAPLAEKQRRAAHTIDNDGSLADTARQVAEFLTSLARR